MHHIGSKVTAIFLNRWILPVGGVAPERVCTYSLFIGTVVVERHMRSKAEIPSSNRGGVRDFFFYILETVDESVNQFESGLITSRFFKSSPAAQSL